MFKLFIERPVLSTVISVLLVLLGIISLIDLPVTQFPDIAPPTVQVTASYPGASAEVVARSVATPIEEAVNGVENMTYMTSNSSNDGSMTLTVYFIANQTGVARALRERSTLARAIPLIKNN
ncbi:MAG: efflux RND transporter permease subunit, partial [Sphingobacteriaceae bacterium]